MVGNARSQCSGCGEPVWQAHDGQWKTRSGGLQCDGEGALQHEPMRCERCDELIDPMSGLDSRVGGEFYDPAEPESPSQLLHPDCVPDGWELA